MKNKIIYLIAFTAIVATGCKKKFLEELKVYDKYDENVFTNEVQTGWYIDRMYNYFFVAYRSPIQQVVGTYEDTRSRSTEELGGTVTNFTNPNKTIQLATEADGYFGTTLPASGVTNNPYTRIRFCNFLLAKIDGIGQVLPEAFRKTAKGQMYFLRALQYYELVRVYGGVPLVLGVQEASSSDETIREPRATAAACFTQITRDFDSAVALLPARWPNATDYGRVTGSAALAMKSRVLLTAASPLFNTDWDNQGSPKWQAALDASLAAETALSSAGYGLYGATAKEWGEMTTATNNAFNKEAIMVQLLSNTITNSIGVNNSWEASVRPRDYGGTGNGISAPKGMVDLFPLANGARPTVANGYVDTFFFENRDPRFYRTFAFSGSKWGTSTNPNKAPWLYRWRASATGTITYSGNNQTSSPAIVRKMSSPGVDTTALTFSGTDIFEYRYAELLLNIAECYAAKGDVANAIAYIGKIRARVGIPSANNYGVGTLSGKYAALEAVLYERRVELAYEGKRFWDVQRWLLYDGVSSMNTTANTVTKLGLTPINGTNRTGYYWQARAFSAANVDPLTPAEKATLVDPDANAATFATQVATLKALYRSKLVMTVLDQPMDRDNNVPVNILFRPNYYLSGLTNTILTYNPWLKQNIGWLDASGGAGTYNSAE